MVKRQNFACGHFVCRNVLHCNAPCFGGVLARICTPKYKHIYSIKTRCGIFLFLMTQFYENPEQPAVAEVSCRIASWFRLRHKRTREPQWELSLLVYDKHVRFCLIARTECRYQRHEAPISRGHRLFGFHSLSPSVASLNNTTRRVTSRRYRLRLCFARFDSVVFRLYRL